MDLEQLVKYALTLLAEAKVSPESQWTLVVSLLAAQNGWTLDEASINFANLLDSLALVQPLTDEPTD